MIDNNKYLTQLAQEKKTPYTFLLFFILIYF